MRLNKLTLTNFRKFESYEVDFDDRLTVLVGDNGSGKSSILDAAAVALGTFLIKMDGVSGKAIQRSDAHLKFFELGDAVDAQPQYPVRIEARGLLGEERISWARSLNGPTGKTTTADAREMMDASERCLAAVRTGQAQTVLPVISYYGTGRLWADNKKRRETFARLTRLDGYADCLDAASNVKLMMDWMERESYKEFQSGKTPAGLAAVYRATELCLARVPSGEDTREGEQSHHPSLHVAFNAETRDLDVTYVDVDGSVRKDALGTMSDGYRNTLSMVADIAFRMALLNPQLSSDVLHAPGVVLIDEVDLHLHPLWQARILEDLLEIFPCVQFIVSTHAPMVISSVSRNRIRVMTSEGAFMPAEESYGLDANVVLTGIMGAYDRQPRVAALFAEFDTLLKEASYEQAEQVLDEIEQETGSNNPELTAARSALFFDRL